MRILKEGTASHYTREEGISSYLLASPRTSNAEYLTTSVVEIRPGGEQCTHSYAPEQICYILEGSGLMTVAHESTHVGPLETVFLFH